MQRVKTRAPAAFKAQVDDAERRLNILFDHLNNEDLLKPNTIEDMANLARALQQRDYNAALAIHVDIMTNRTDECGNWMVSEHRFYNFEWLLTSITTGRCEATDQHEPRHPVNDTLVPCQVEGMLRLGITYVFLALFSLYFSVALNFLIFLVHFL